MRSIKNNIHQSEDEMDKLLANVPGFHFVPAGSNASDVTPYDSIDSSNSNGTRDKDGEGNVGQKTRHSIIF